MGTYGAVPLIADLPVFRAASLESPRPGAAWQFESLVGILSEISEDRPRGALSFAAEIVVDAQRHGEPVAWVAGTHSVFFPPDLHARGVDLASVALVRAGGADGPLVAAEWLVRCGALGLVVVDAEEAWTPDDASLGRLQKLAGRSLCAVVFLTRKHPREPSLGSRISLRACVSRRATAPIQVEVRTVKDKRSRGASRQGRQYDGPPGMC